MGLAIGATSMGSLEVTLVSPQQSTMTSHDADGDPDERPGALPIATARKCMLSQQSHLEVMNSPGVDAVLVLVLALGLLAFEVEPHPHRVGFRASVKARIASWRSNR